MDDRRPRPLGLKQRKGHGVCALCGERKKLTKTHVPPQVAGNRDEVVRYFVHVVGNGAIRGRGEKGGIWVFGHCTDCNGLQAKYDGAYAEFVDLARHRTRPTLDLHIPGTAQLLPNETIRPGAVVRSVLIGLTALNPNIRILYPEFVESLLDEKPHVTVPADLKLRLALTDDPIARVGGAVGDVLLFHRVRPYETALGTVSMGSIYFAPLAWQLADADRYQLMDYEGWADVTPWTKYAPGDAIPLQRLVRRLPTVTHPAHVPSHGWTMLLNSEIAVIAEADLPPKPT